MKKLLSITCVMLLAAGIAVAQDTPPSGEQPAQPAPAPQQEQMPQSDQAADQSQTTIRGCLSGSDNNFTISDQSGQTYKLSGDFTLLSQHVGHEVELTGKAGEVSGAADQSAGEAGAATTGDQKSFEFTNVTMISENCAAGTEQEARPESDAAATDPNAAATATDPNATATDPNAAATATDPNAAATTTPDASAQTTPPAATDPSVTAQQQEAPPAEAPVAQQPEEQPAEQPATEQEPAATQAQDQAAADEQLPQTATPLPLLALLGFGALAAGLWTRKK